MPDYFSYRLRLCSSTISELINTTPVSPDLCLSVIHDFSSFNLQSVFFLVLKSDIGLN